MTKWSRVRSGRVWSGRVWSGRVWSGRVWSGRVPNWSGIACLEREILNIDVVL